MNKKSIRSIDLLALLSLFTPEALKSVGIDVKSVYKKAELIGIPKTYYWVQKKTKMLQDIKCCYDEMKTYTENTNDN